MLQWGRECFSHAIFLEKETDMFNFSIMRLDEGNLEAFCQDIVYQVTHGIATMPLFIMTLTPEGDPAIDKADMLCRVYEKW